MERDKRIEETRVQLEGVRAEHASALRQGVKDAVKDALSVHAFPPHISPESPSSVFDLGLLHGHHDAPLYLLTVHVNGKGELFHSKSDLSYPAAALPNWSEFTAEDWVEFGERALVQIRKLTLEKQRRGY